MTTETENQIFRVYTVSDGKNKNQYMTDGSNKLLYHPLNWFLWNENTVDRSKPIPIGERVRLKSSFYAENYPDINPKDYSNIVYPSDKEVIDVFEGKRGDAEEEYNFPKVRVYLLAGKSSNHKIAITNDENLLFNYEIHQGPDIKSPFSDHYIKDFVEKPQAIFNLRAKSFNGRLLRVGTPVEVRFVNNRELWVPKYSVQNVQEIPFSTYWKLSQNYQEGKSDAIQIEESIRARYESEVIMHKKAIKKRIRALSRIEKSIQQKLHQVGKVETLEETISNQFFMTGSGAKK